MNTKKTYTTPAIEIIVINNGEGVCLKTVSKNAQGPGLAKPSYNDWDDWDDSSDWESSEPEQ